MATFSVLITFYLLAPLIALESQTYYVAKNGIDNISCGETISNPCGTLYKASQIIDQLPESIKPDSFLIYVIDGQNAGEIANITSTTYDPCLPISFDPVLHITITFDIANIHDLNDWYPRDICDRNTNKKYINEYMFDGAESLKINNLIINNYGKQHFYPFIRSINHYNASITCIQCKFESIIYDTADANHSKPLFHTMSSIYMIRSSFINISTSVASEFDHSPLIYCDHSRLTGDATRHFFFIETIFSNIVSVESIVDIRVSAVRYADRPPTMTIYKSTLKDLSLTKSIIYDTTSFIRVIINDTLFDNIISGCIYYANKEGSSKDVHMDNVSVTSIQQLFKNNPLPLFHFKGNDVTITINKMYIHYIYNTDKSCKISNSSPEVSNTKLNITCEFKYCSNPVQGIHAVGTVQITNMEINMDVIPAYTPYKDDGKCKQFVFYGGKNGKPLALINNAGYMNITNISIGRPICHELIYNSNRLWVDNLSFNKLDTSSYNPNDLRSDDIIKAQGEFVTLYVSNSHFFGSKKQIHASGGIGTVSDSIFERSSLPLYIDTCDQFTVMRSNFSNNGQFNKRVEKDSIVDDYITGPFRIWKSKDILVINNSISGFEPKANLYIGYTENISIIGNTFNVDATGLFYDVSRKHLTFSAFYAPLYVKYSSDIQLIHNIFDKNHVQPSRYWVSYYKNEGINCLSSNSFSNVALNARTINITSCFRPGLIDGVYNGSIDASLLGQMNHFLLDIHENIPYLFSLSESKTALDQINITWINDDNENNITKQVPLSMRDSDLVIVDSFITNDIAYKHKLCDVLHNDRLSENIEGVALLHIKCAYYTNYGVQYGWNQTLDSNVTKSVDHFSATKLNFSTESWSYFPGELLHFEYHITDILGHIIDYPLSENGLVVQLHSNKFSTEFNIIHTETNAILLTDVSINDNTGDEYDIYVQLENDAFVAEYPMLALNITGCPTGWGPDSNNISCVICNTDSYNLIQNNVHRCSSCNPDFNSGIKCMDGTILVAKDHWVGFDDNHSIISSICPPSYCCGEEQKCNYENKDALCALNRDPDSPLCSKCMAGFSESMNSINCIQCDNSYEFEYLLTPLLLALLFSVIVIRTDNVRKDEKEDAYLNPSSSRRRYVRIMMQIMLSKCVLYYEQAISEMVFTITPLTLFSSVFNLSVITNSFTSTDLCFMNGLRAKQKILIDLMIPLTMIIICGWLYFVFLLCCGRQGSLTVCCGRRRVNFGKMFLTLFTLVVGKILDVLFGLLSCKTVGNRIVHFYFADEECFGATWILSFVCLFIVIFSFSALFLKIKSMTINQRQNPNHATFVYTSRYKPQYYYFEFVIFIRRILIALFAAFAHDIVMKLGFIFVITCFAILQHFYAPFIIHEANNMEAILLHCLIFVLLIQFPYAYHLDPTLISVVLSILIIFPVFLMLYYILKVILMRKESWKHNIGSNARKKQQIAEDSDTEDDNDIIAVVNEMHRRKTVGNDLGNNSVEMNKKSELVNAMCAECEITKQCRAYDNGAFFYCIECWENYEDLYEENSMSI